MSSFSFNNNVSGGNTQINQGQNVTATQTNAGVPAEMTPERVAEEVVQAIPEEVPPTERVDIEQELQSLVAMPIVQQAEPQTTDRINALIQRIEPWGPRIREGLWAFGEASLKALASSNPVVAGLVAMCERFNDKTNA